MTDDLIDEFRRDRDRHYETAERAIDGVQRELARALEDLHIRDEAGVARPFVRQMPGGGQVLNPQTWLKAEEALIRFWDAATVVALLEQARDRDRPEVPAPAGKPALALVGGSEGPSVRDVAEQFATAFFENREPGSVLEPEYQEKVDEIADAIEFLRENPIYRVELNKKCPPARTRIAFVEATDEDDAQAPYAKYSANRRGVKVLSVRRATEMDVLEFIETGGND